MRMNGQRHDLVRIFLGPGFAGCTLVHVSKGISLDLVHLVRNHFSEGSTLTFGLRVLLMLRNVEI